MKEEENLKKRRRNMREKISKKAVYLYWPLFTISPASHSSPSLPEEERSYLKPVCSISLSLSGGEGRSREGYLHFSWHLWPTEEELWRGEEEEEERGGPMKWRKISLSVRESISVPTGLMRGPEAASCRGWWQREEEEEEWEAERMEKRGGRSRLAPLFKKEGND